jgi:outer membrane protein assembly factor BamB
MLVGNRDISNAGVLWILNGKDCPLATFYPRTGDHLNAAVAADLNGDGRPEAMAATCSLTCIDPRTMEVRWAHAFGDEVRGVVVLPAQAGATRIVAASRNEFVVAFDTAGRRQWAAHAGVPVEFLVTIRRGNDVLLAAVGATGRVVVLDTAGQVRYQYDLGAVPSSVAVPEARPELLCVATADGLVTALTLPAQ